MKAYFEDWISNSDAPEFLTAFPFEAFVKENDSFLAHWHNDIEIIYVHQGSLTVGVNSNVKILEEGDIAFCNSGDIHFFDSKENYSAIIILKLDPQIISSIAIQIHEKFISPFFIKKELLVRGMPEDIFHTIQNHFFCILNEMKNKNLHYDIIVRGQIIELLGLVLRHVFQYDALYETMYNSSPKQKEIVRQAISYLEENYYNDVSLEEVAQKLLVSRFYLSKVFNKLTGQSFKTYLNNLRLEKALSLLATSQGSITDIALDCGFNTIRTFNRVFKELTGAVPSSLR